MKLTKLIKKLFQKSKFENPSTLANYTNQTQPFVANWLNGTKESRRKEDELFEELTNDISVEELIAAIDLIQNVRAAQIEKEQIL